MTKIFLLLLFFACILQAQTDSKRWAPIRVTYEIEEISNTTDSASNGLISGLQSFYKYFISDLDGDNCPFSPSCSNFFVEAYRETNLFKAVLMFSDRFTRDINIFNRDNYKQNSTGKLIDIVENYK